MKLYLLPKWYWLCFAFTPIVAGVVIIATFRFGWLFAGITGFLAGACWIWLYCYIEVRLSDEYKQRKR